jgi:hypothetical protein
MEAPVSTESFVPNKLRGALSHTRNCHRNARRAKTAELRDVNLAEVHEQSN